MKSIRTYICLVLAVLVCMSVFAGCGSTAKDGFDAEMEIGVITRESGSGTRGAFIELFGIEEKNESGEKIDHTIESAAAAVTLSDAVHNNQNNGFFHLRYASNIFFLIVFYYIFFNSTIIIFYKFKIIRIHARNTEFFPEHLPYMSF